VIGPERPVFNRFYGVCGKLAPAFWGRQVEAGVPELIRAAGMRILTDQFVRQGFIRRGCWWRSASPDRR